MVTVGLLLTGGAPHADLPGFQLTQCSSPSKHEVKLTEDGPSIRNVYHLSRGAWASVTRFRNPHHIFEYGTSSDGRYLLVWHMDFSPRRVSVYDLRRGGRRISRFEPGAGGSFCWNSQHNIVHVSGCGSGCRICKVYRRDGKVLFELGGLGMDVSPSGRYLAHFSSSSLGDQEIAIYDLHETRDGSGRIATTPIWIVGSVGGVDRIDWLQEHSVTVDYVDPEGTKKSQITLDLKSRADRR